MKVNWERTYDVEGTEMKTKDQEDPIKHLRGQKNVTIYGEKHYQNWHIFLVERTYENSLVKVSMGYPPIVVVRYWYSKYLDKDGEKQEWGSMCDNNTLEGVIPEWELVEQHARKCINGYVKMEVQE